MNNDCILITDDIFFFMSAYLKVLDSEFNHDVGSLLFSCFVNFSLRFQIRSLNSA
jgi:hypothetical protein